MRQHFKKETSFEGVIINEKSLTKFMKKKNDDVE